MENKNRTIKNQQIENDNLRFKIDSLNMVVDGLKTPAHIELKRAMELLEKTNKENDQYQQDNNKLSNERATLVVELRKIKESFNTELANQKKLQETSIRSGYNAKIKLLDDKYKRSIDRLKIKYETKLTHLDITRPPEQTIFQKEAEEELFRREEEVRLAEKRLGISDNTKNFGTLGPGWPSSRHTWD